MNINLTRIQDKKQIDKWKYPILQHHSLLNI